MEDTLREKTMRVQSKLISLNPCFNGRYSQSEKDKEKQNKLMS